MSPARSVLDLSPVASGKTPRDALLATVEIARHVEALGLRRYWVAVEEARAYAFDDDERALALAYGARGLVGRAAVVRDALHAHAKECDADEVMVTSATADDEARKPSFTLLARAW